MSGWEIEYTDEFGDWYDTLDEDTQESLRARIAQVGQHGPTVRRPVVGEVAGSSIHNLKEIRVSSVRVLFVFDPRQTAILLLGADKAEHGWKDWYRTAIAQAEALYATYLDELKAEGLL